MNAVARTLLHSRSLVAVCLLTSHASAQVQTQFFGALWPMVLSADGSTIAGIDGSTGGGGVPGFVAVWNRFDPAVQVAAQEFPFGGSSPEGAPLSLSDAGDRLLYSLPSLPAWGATWTQAAGSVAMPGSTSSSFALKTSGDGLQTFGFNGDQELLRWTGAGPPQVLCAAGCGISPTGVTTNGDAVVGTLAGTLRYWSASTGTVVVQPALPFGGGPHIDISSDGSLVVGLTPSNELFTWTPSSGQTVIGKPAWAHSLQQVFVDDDGDRVFTNALVSGGGPTVSVPSMWEPGVGWTNFSQYLASRGATGYAGQTRPVYFREVSADGTAAIVEYWLGASHSWTRAVIYFGDDAPGTIGDNYCGPMPGWTWITPAALAAVGSESVASNSVTLRATGLPPMQAAIVLSSRGVGSIPIPGGALGTLCLGGSSPIGRHNRPGEIRMTGQAGMFELGLDLTRLPSGAGTTSAMPGETWYFQAWSRHSSNSGYSSVLTDAVAITFQ